MLLNIFIAKELIKIQAPDFKSFEELNNDNGCNLESMASEWSYSCQQLENMANKTVKSVKGQDDLTFWADDPSHGAGNKLFKQKDEPDKERTDVTEQNDPEPQGEAEFQRYALIPGTEIMWDYIRDEPVDMVTYDIND